MQIVPGRSVVPRALGGVCICSLALGVPILQAPDAGARRAFMAEQALAALRLHDAIVRGELADARHHAREIAARQPDGPIATGASVFLTLIDMAASEIEQAPALEVAARSTAVLLMRCGECHAAQHVTPGYSRYLGAPLDVGWTMREHQQATDLMMVGLVEPSPSSWLAGARAFGQARLARDAMPDRTSRAGALIADARLTNLATDAVMAVRPPDRARVYGRVLSTCARCHARDGLQRRGPDRPGPP